MTSSAASHVLLEDTLKSLKMTSLIKTYKECSRQAAEDGLSYEEFLYELLRQEKDRRDANGQIRRITEARFPQLKPLEKTDLGKWPELESSIIHRLILCNYIDTRENIVILGKHGTGKSHAATMLGIEACRKGYRTLFTTAADLVNTLIEARSQRELKNIFAKLDRIKLLIVDELGYIPLSLEGSQLLFQVFSRRYEKGSTIVTTNLPFQEWTSVLQDPNMTAALLDRLTHHCHILQFNWESIRFRDSLNHRKQREKNEEKPQ